MKISGCLFLPICQASLTRAEEEIFETQLSKRIELRIELEEPRPIWEGLCLIPQAQPGLAMRARFYRRLHAVTGDQSAFLVSKLSWWKRSLLQQTAIALVFFFVGMCVGQINMGVGSSLRDPANLSSQVQGLRQTIALSLLDRQSAISRLEQISWSSRVEQPDRELLSALLMTLNNDTNINVRLASLDALERFTNDSEIRLGLTESIPRQDSPLVQIALIDVLVQIRDEAVLSELRRLTGDATVNGAVRQRAQWALDKLRLQ